MARSFEALARMGDAAAVFRAHPDYTAQEAMIASMRVVLQAGSLWDKPHVA